MSLLFTMWTGLSTTRNRSTLDSSTGWFCRLRSPPTRYGQGDVWPFHEISISSVRYICFVLTETFIISFLFNRSYVSIYCTTKQSAWGKWMGLNCIKNFLKYEWIYSSASKAWNIRLSTFYCDTRSFLYHDTKMVSFKKLNEEDNAFDFSVYWWHLVTALNQSFFCAIVL